MINFKNYWKHVSKYIITWRRPKWKYLHLMLHYYPWILCYGVNLKMSKHCFERERYYFRIHIIFCWREMEKNWPFFIVFRFWKRKVTLKLQFQFCKEELFSIQTAGQFNRWINIFLFPVSVLCLCVCVRAEIDFLFIYFSCYRNVSWNHDVKHGTKKICIKKCWAKHKNWNRKVNIPK